MLQHIAHLLQNEKKHRAMQCFLYCLQHLYVFRMYFVLFVLFVIYVNYENYD